MRNQELAEELKSFIGAYLAEQGLDLVELNCRYEPLGLFLRILADKPEGGITVAECSTLNHRISSMLDEKDFIPQRYILEVSSPGLDRPLANRKDFLRCKNRAVRFFLKEPVNNKLEIEGAVKEVKEESVAIETKDGAVEIVFLKINKAKQVI
jgi:ribosome maturation factor RimP